MPSGNVLLRRNDSALATLLLDCKEEMLPSRASMSLRCDITGLGVTAGGGMLGKTGSPRRRLNTAAVDRTPSLYGDEPTDDDACEWMAVPDEIFPSISRLRLTPESPRPRRGDSCKV